MGSRERRISHDSEVRKAAARSRAMLERVRLWRNPVEVKPLTDVVGTRANFDQFVSQLEANASEFRK